MKKVLIVVTSHDRLGYTAEQTGLWLEEFAAAYYRFIECGLRVAVASPAGGEVPIDPKSVGRRALGPDGKRFIGGTDKILDLAHRLAEIDADDYDALFYPGGHGPMWDLANDHRNARIASRFFELGKPIAAVCHGPAALVKARRQDGYPIVFGKRLTGFSNAEERELGMDGIVPFLLADRLSELGAIYCRGANWRPHVVTDGALISGQNPHSTGGVAEALIRWLRERNARTPLRREPAAAGVR